VNTRGPILVTGAGGFAGSHLVEQLASQAPVVAWYRSEPAGTIRTSGRWVGVDLLDRDRVRHEIRTLRPSAVYHCAGAAHVAHSWRDTTTPLAGNVLATHYLLDAVRRAECETRMLLTGSAAIYAASHLALTEDSPVAPASPYALSKLAQEQLGLRAVAEDGVEVIVARAFNHTGPRQSPTFVAPGFARQIALIECGEMPPVMQVGNLDARRDLSDVRDTVEAYRLIMANGAPGQVYNVASGTARSIRQLLDALLARSRVSITVTQDPALLRPSDTPVVLGDAARLRALTGWTPRISFDRMLDDLLDYWRERASRPSV
jgi:GDP-4-dehydro-6-deoxy-D-mannose reductase